MPHFTTDWNGAGPGGDASWPETSSASESPDAEIPDCAHCGGACCKMDWIVAFDKAEPVPRPLTAPGRILAGNSFSSERMMRRNPDKSCVALKNGRCTIYEQRPTLCREFEPGSDCCLEAIAEIGQTGS